jgi:hypothetical protein
MSKLFQFASVVLIFVLLLGIVFFFGKTFLDSSSEVQAGIISFIGVMLVALYTHSTTKKREITARHFTEKRKVYLHFIGFIFQLFEAQKKTGGMKESELIKEMTKFKQNLLVWGSADVINAYNDFENANEVLENNQQDTSTVFFIVEKLYRAIRQDLGHDDSNLPNGELVGLTLNAESKKQVRRFFKSE